MPLAAAAAEIASLGDEGGSKAGSTAGREGSWAVGLAPQVQFNEE